MIVGIDLGTTNSAIAFVDEKGIPQIISNKDGERITPSVILFEGDIPVVGLSAKINSISDPLNTVQFVKRQMGNTNFSFMKEDGEEFTTEELSAIIIKRLKQDAEDFFGKTIDRAVVTVPAYFDEVQRKATQDSAKIAGLYILKIINEPTAAALAYGYYNKDVNENLMVYDLGGGTFDVTVMNVKNNEIIIKATGGDRNLGGFDFDNKIIEYIRSEFLNQHGIDLYDDLNTIQELREKAEVCKKILSTREKSLVVISSQGQTLKIELTREKFNKMISPLLNRTIFIMNSVLEDSNLVWSNIDKILLVGGSTRINLLSDLIYNETGKMPSKEVNPDEVVAIGASIQAHIIDCEDGGKDVFQGTKISDVNSHSLGIVAFDNSSAKESNVIILKKNTIIPAKASRIFYTSVDNQEYIEIRVTEGEDDEIQYVRIIGVAKIKLSSRPAGSPLKIIVSYDENGIVHVTALDGINNKELKNIDIDRKANLSDEEIVCKKNKITKLSIQ